MALLQATLKTQLLRLVDSENPSFLGYPSTLEQTAENWTTAYDIYCQSAQDISDDGVATVNTVGFKNALIANLPEGTGTGALAAAAFESAFVAYWMGAVFNIGNLPPGGVGGNGIFGVEISSVVTTVTPNVLYGLLLAEFNKAVFETNMDTKANTLAALFHATTISAVICTISGTDTTPAPSGPIPLVNVSPIH